MNRGFLLVTGLALLSGCASIMTGTTQRLSVNTSPEGASCALIREGEVIGRIDPTPGSVLVDRTKHDITVECVKDGYQMARFVNESGSEGATLGNIVLGGGVGWAVDSARGADNKYQEQMNITLTK